MRVSWACGECAGGVDEWLSISRHTVSDHTKLIFTKCGVTSRGELVADLFSQHIIEGFHAAVDHV